MAKVKHGEIRDTNIDEINNFIRLPLSAESHKHFSIDVRNNLSKTKSTSLEYLD